MSSPGSKTNLKPNEEQGSPAESGAHELGAGRAAPAVVPRAVPLASKLALPSVPRAGAPATGRTAGAAAPRAAAGPLPEIDDATAPVEAPAMALKKLAAALVPGTVIDNKYAVQSLIGRGGMGLVVSARHTELGRDVALKFLCYTGDPASNNDLRARFRREAQISAKLRNEHITRVLDVGSWQKSSYMVMERLEGTDLRRKLKALGGSLSLPVALNYTLQVCEGIAEAHAHSIIHRDLKPSNLFVTRAPDGTDLIKIMDFGISKWKDSEIGEATRDGTVLGSPKYMAPEQIFENKTLDVRADIWSIGAILYEMLTGRTPYRESTLARFCAELTAGPPPRLDLLNPDVPTRVADVVARCLERDPNARIQSVAELAGSLLSAIDAPGDTLRQRLAAIIEMRPIDDGTPVSSVASVLTNLGPASGASHLKHPVSVPVPTGVTVVSTAVSVASPPPRAMKRNLYLVGGLAVAGLLGAVGARLALPRGDVPAPTQAVVAARAPESAPSFPSAAPTASAAASAEPEARSGATAEPSATTGAKARARPTPRHAPRAAPRVPVAAAPKAAEPKATPAPAPKAKGDDDIPSMR
jgi:serine/threonine protein kinase